MVIYSDVTKAPDVKINVIWSIGAIEYEKSRKNIEGFQICYPMTSSSTLNNPTPAEMATLHTFNMIWETTVDALKKFCEQKDCKENGFWNQARDIPCKEDWTYAVKPLYDYSNTVNQKTGGKYKDYTKPMRA